jgi:pimeloyl-ACP methyl ester carboxylesterase
LQAVLLKYSPKAVIGHSMGGMTVLYNEHKNPNPYMGKIVTIGSPSEYHEIFIHYQNLLGFGSKVMKALESYFYSRFGCSSKELSSSNFVVYNSKKGLLFHDRLDMITPYKASEVVHKHWKDSEFITTEGFGHSMHQDEVNAKIIAFLNQ